jgi:hypothetical protein
MVYEPAEEGYVLARNPMNPSQISRVTLSPEAIDCIVFWTKDPAAMMDKLSQLETLGYYFYFQFTLTPYGRDIERNLRDKKEIIKTFRQLSHYLGKDRVLWRYDPIIINKNMTERYHFDKFKFLCSELQGYTDICTISFVDAYHKLNKKIKDEIVKEIPEEQMHLLASGISKIGGEYGIDLRACCEKLDFGSDGIRQASCIDKELVEHINGRTIDVKKDKSQRPGCGCSQSVDIGVYNTCRNGCVYCYANHSDESIDRNCRLHNPDADILIGVVDEAERIKSRN